MNTLINTVTKSDAKNLEELCFLQEIVENLEDGVLILTQRGELVHTNTSAINICNQIHSSNVNLNSVPSMIWERCKLLLQNQLNYECKKSTIWSEEIIVNRSLIFRLRVRQLDIEISEQALLLVTIENRYESLKNVALSEAYKYRLTQREAEIWSLYRATSSYKQIAEKLFITVNTVKKHIKNIRAKKYSIKSNKKQRTAIISNISL